MGREQLQEPENSVLQQAHGTQQSRAPPQDGGPESLICQATAILLQPDPQIKADQTHVVANLWRQQRLIAGDQSLFQPPDRPGRDDSKVRLI